MKPFFTFAGMNEYNYPQVVVRSDRLASIGRRHPWIFSKGIKRKDSVEEGDIVRIVDAAGKFLAVGQYHNATIAVRILSYEDRPLDQQFWDESIKKCLQRRKILDLPNGKTNAFRLVHGEGDNLSGLIIDIYGDISVIQCHTIGMHRCLDVIKKALEHTFGSGLSIYNKSQNTLPPEYGTQQTDGFLSGSKVKVDVIENGHHFYVDPVEGQKTGFFLDQRDNRQLLGQFAKDKKILNLYCYTGGFSIYALDAGASFVCSIDASSKAIQMLEENLTLNNQDKKTHQSITGDVKRVLQEIPDDFYDIIVVDPPAFAKSQFKSHNAVQAYKRINAMAISKIKSGGLIFTFSCSQVIDQLLFQNTITAAAIESQRDARVLHILSQGPDHPVSIFHPEGKYLKGLVLEVE